MFLIIYMYLFNRSLRAETHLGPDGTRLKQNAQAKLKAYISMLAIGLWKSKERETQIWKHEMKEKKTMATPNKSSWTLLISAFGTRERRFSTQSQLPQRLNSAIMSNHLPV